jgi:hypothetical protein
VRQHVVRLARPDPGVRTEHHADTGPLHPDDVGPDCSRRSASAGGSDGPPGSRIIPSRSTSSVTAAGPENRVGDRSGAPTRTRRRNRRISRTLPTR